MRKVQTWSSHHSSCCTILAYIHDLKLRACGGFGIKGTQGVSRQELEGALQMNHWHQGISVARQIPHAFYRCVDCLWSAGFSAAPSGLQGKDNCYEIYNSREIPDSILFARGHLDLRTTQSRLSMRPTHTTLPHPDPLPQKELQWCFGLLL